MALYDDIGTGYSSGRRTDPRWAAILGEALGTARRIANVGAGTGSYEPADATVIAFEPSVEMIRQRTTPTPVIRAVAEALPVRDNAFDSALAVLTVHHWTDWRAGLAQLRRIAAAQVVLAYDTALHADFWFVRDYVPQIAELELSRPSAADIAAELNAHTVVPLPLPFDFTDGVFPAYWRRPAAYLDPAIRRSCSAIAQTDPDAVDRGVAALRADLASGDWAATHADLLAATEYDAGFRLVIAGERPC